jgi:hypothetical protein
MALDDFRSWHDIGAADGRKGSIGMEAAAGRDVLRFAVMDPDGNVIELELDYADAGHHLDQVRAGMGVLLARQGDPTAAAAVIGSRILEDAQARMAAARAADDTPTTEGMPPAV